MYHECHIPVLRGNRYARSYYMPKNTFVTLLLFKTHRVTSDLFQHATNHHSVSEALKRDFAYTYFFKKERLYKSTYKLNRQQQRVCV